MHQALQPHPPQDMFDLIVGTSTGGLLAVAMGLRNMSLDECDKIYKVLGQKVGIARAGGRAGGRAGPWGSGALGPDEGKGPVYGGEAKGEKEDKRERNRAQGGGRVQSGHWQHARALGALHP